MPGDSIQIGPFVGGLNNFSDPTAVADNQLVQAENLELDLDGSLVSRPPIVDLGVPFPLGATGNMTLLGYYNAPGSIPYLIASDGLNTTYYYTGTAWSVLTNTIAASALEQFNDKAWLLAPVGSTNPGGSWTPSGGFVADANMPKGEVIVAHKFRLWVAAGKGATSNGTRMYVSKVLGTTPFWPTTPDFIDVGAGDGQNIVQIVVYYSSLLIFRTASVYSFQFTSDPASGATSLVLPGIGLSDKDAVVAFENFLYFMYDDRAYEFVNNRANQINVSVPFRAGSRSGLYKPYAVSIFGSRAVFSYYDTMYVFSLRTRTWTTWISPTRGPIGKLLSQGSDTAMEQVIAHSSRLVDPVITTTNLVVNPSMEVASGTAMVNTNYVVDPSMEIGTGWSLYTDTATGAMSASGSPVAGTHVGRATWSAVPVTSPASWFSPKSSLTGVVAGTDVTGSVYMRVINPADVMSAARCDLQFLDSSGATIVTVTGPSSVLAANTWERRSTTTTVPAGAVFVRVAASISGPAGWVTPVDTLFDVDAAMLEVGTLASNYFDGSTPAAGDFTYSWTGSANNSSSVQTGLALVGYSVQTDITRGASIQSSAWSAKGSKSIRVIPRDTNVSYVELAGIHCVTGHTYTVMGTIHLAAPQTGVLAATARGFQPVGAAGGMDVTYSKTAPNLAGTYEVRGTFVATWDTIGVRLYNGAPQGGGDVYWDKVAVVDGVYTGDYFDGGMADTYAYDYAWTGTADTSTSTVTTKRYAPTLQITDGITSDAETFECSMTTKNYNYEASSAYKRLFWWGVDAIFRGQVTATVVPVSFNYAVTWDQLAAYSWDTLEQFTWEQPMSGTLSVETVRDTAGSGSMRKFTKFNKSLRFRQAQFKLVFDTDGSILSAPVRIFSLMTYIKAKERVSKVVT